MKLGKVCGVSILAERRSALYVAAALLFLCQSGGEAQERSTVGPPSSAFRLDVAPADGAVREARDLRGSLAPAGRRSSKLGLLDDSALEGIASILRLSDVESYKEHPAAGIKLSHTTAAMRFELPVMPQSRLSFVADLGVGTTRLRSYELGDYPVGNDYRLSEVFFSFKGGLTLHYAVSDGCRAFVGARHYLFMSDARAPVLDDTVEARRLLEGSAWTFPLTFGFQLNFR